MSFPENAKVIAVDVVLPPFGTVFLLPSITEVIELDGAAVSTVQLSDAGVGSLFPTLSSEYILKVWIPSFNDCDSL